MILRFFLNTLFSFSHQLSSILLNIGAISEDYLYLSDYTKLLGLKNNLSSPLSPIVLTPVCTQKIEFRHVHFSYPGTSKEVLNNINIVFDKKTHIAIVGKNGAGKTTLIKLLMRFYDATKGDILIDGINLKNIDINSWYKHLGVLFQNFARYHLTVKDNVIFGNIEKYSKKNLDKALKNADAIEFVQRLPQKNIRLLEDHLKSVLSFLEANGKNLQSQGHYTEAPLC